MENITEELARVKAERERAVRNSVLLEAIEVLADCRNMHEPGMLFQAWNEAMGKLDDLRRKPAAAISAQAARIAELEALCRDLMGEVDWTGTGSFESGEMDRLRYTARIDASLTKEPP